MLAASYVTPLFRATKKFRSLFLLLDARFSPRLDAASNKAI
jgi:hypothetical protein